MNGRQPTLCLCGECAGSGEGMYPGTNCQGCGGKGEVPLQVPEDRDEEDDDQ